MSWSEQVPASWHVAAFEHVVDAPIIYGIIQPGEHTPNGVPYVRPVDVVDGVIQVDRLPCAHPDIAARYKRATLAAGDIVLSIVGTIGKVAVVPKELAGANITQTSVRLRPSVSASGDWIRYALQAPTMTRQFDAKKFGLGLQRLNVAHVRECELPIAPLNEQCRIVEKLDAVFEKSHAAKARLERLPALLDQLKRSILAAAFRGDLTKDWRAANPDVEPASMLLDRIRAERRRKWEEALRAKGKDPKKATYEEPAPVDTSELPELPEGWAWASVEQLLSAKMCNGISIPGSDQPPGIRSLKLNAFTDDGIDFRATRFIDIDAETVGDLRLRRGDFLVSRGNGSLHLVGKGVRVAEEPDEATVFPDTAIRFRVSDEFDSAGWLAAIWPSPGVRQQVEGRAKTTAGIFKVSQGDLASIAIPVPPLIEARLAASLLSACLSAARQLGRRIAAQTTAVEGFEQSALAKAFRGELVPQDPTDEAADVLLERLRAARAAEPVARRTRTTRPAAASPAPTTTALAGEPVDRIIAVLRATRRQSTSAIADATGLDAADVRSVLKSLERLGKVSVEGKARGTTYVWQGGP